MAQSVPQLDVFYIDFSKEKEGEKKKSIWQSLAVSSTAIVGSALVPVVGSAALATFLTPIIFKDVKELIDNNRFYIITSEEELNGFENPNGNAWKTNEKSLKKKQYYIRHPKESKQHILIEAGDFFDYIEDEQIEELVHFVKAHCDARLIHIERTELSQVSGQASAKIKAADVTADVACKKDKHICVSISNPNGFPRECPREKYHWIDGSVIQCIKSLTEGSKFEKTYERDFTFGLSADEASTIGLKTNMHKNYSYNIYVETVGLAKNLPQEGEINSLKMRLDKNEQDMNECKKKARIRHILLTTLAGLGIIALAALAILL